MRIFSYWSKVEKTVQIDGTPQALHGYGGSNDSSAEAVRDGHQRLASVLDRIHGTRAVDEDYEADIREEITARIDGRNVVTRNRYGAEVLNTTALMFVDIDEPRYSWWEVFAGRTRDLAKKKERIVAFLRKRAESPDFRGLGLRVYETHKGIRAIVTGREFDPKAPGTRKLLRSLEADRLYTLLCAKQGCFRARLTPKPHRIKCRTHKISFPRESGATEQAFQEWLAEYQQARRAFATCRFLCTIGPKHGDPVIDYHDQVTEAHTGLKLA